MEVKQINEQVSVGGQIAPEDVATLKAMGFVAIVNNRPDGESPGQPTGAEIAAAAEAAGLGYHAIPMGRAGVSPDMIAQTREALAESGGPVFCFCRSGTRSTTLWALSQAGQLAPDEIVQAAAKAGYDMSHLLGHLSGPLA